MSKIALSPDANGAGIFTIASPNSGTDRTLTLPDNTGTLVSTGSSAAVTPAMLSQPLTSGTALAYNWNGLTTNTVLNFTGIPSWVKRITVMLAGLSTNGTSVIQIQIGTSSGVETSGYLGAGGYIQNAGASGSANFTTGFAITQAVSATSIYHGSMIITLLGSNQWVANGAFARSDSAVQNFGQGSKTLSGTLDRVRITTVNGTDVFDAGTVNILYE